MIDIAGRRIGPGEPCYIIAEAGVNHNGSIDTALRLVDAAKRAGADACKFQTWNTARICRPDSPMFRTLLPLELSEGQFRHIKAHCDDVGIVFLSTPDDEIDADFLDELVPAFKIGSGNLRNLPFLRHVVAKGKPIIMSTGMGSLQDVREAVHAIEEGWPPTPQPWRETVVPLVLLHCCSIYPALGEAEMQFFDCSLVNLRAMDAMAAFGYPVGYSDHSRSVAVACAAIARGACVYEAHLRPDRSPRGPDWGVSLTADQFDWWVESIRTVEMALGDGVKRPSDAELETRKGIEEWRKG